MGSPLREVVKHAGQSDARLAVAAGFYGLQYVQLVCDIVLQRESGRRGEDLRSYVSR